MNQTAGEREPGSSWGVTGTEARETLRAYGAQFAAHSRPVMPVADEGDDDRETGDSARPAPTEAPTLETRPIDVAALPAAIVRLMQEFRDRHQGAELSPVRYLTVGDDGYAVAGNGELPAEDDLVLFSVTETVASSGSFSVTAHVLAAESGPGGPVDPGLD